MQGALERTQENQYHLYNVDGAGDDITELARVQSSSVISACLSLRVHVFCRMTNYESISKILALLCLFSCGETLSVSSTFLLMLGLLIRRYGPRSKRTGRGSSRSICRGGSSPTQMCHGCKACHSIACRRAGPRHC